MIEVAGGWKLWPLTAANFVLPWVLNIIWYSDLLVLGAYLSSWGLGTPLRWLTEYSQERDM